MDLNSRVLFNHNQNDRLTTVNEPPFDLAPRIYVGLTKRGNIVRYRDDLDDSHIIELQTVVSKDPGRHLAEIIEILGKRQQITKIWIGPAFVFPILLPSDTEAVQVTPRNKNLLSEHFPYLVEEFAYKTPIFAIVVGGKAVSVCHSARKYTNAVAAGVFTVEEYRGLGYGSEVSKAWAMELQRLSNIAFYSTEWVNHSSQSVAKKLGLELCGIDLHIS